MIDGSSQTDDRPMEPTKGACICVIDVQCSEYHIVTADITQSKWDIDLVDGHCPCPRPDR